MIKVKRRIISIFILLFGATGIILAQTNSSAADSIHFLLHSPRQSVHTFLFYQQEGSQNLTRASLTMQKAEGKTQDQKIELAKKLKRILDSRGLLVEYPSVPDNPDYVDSLSEQHRYTLFSKLPRIYLVKNDSVWVFSQSTIDAIPAIYRQTFSLFVDVVVDELPAYMHSSWMGLQAWQYIALFLWLLIGLMLKYIFEFFFENYATRLVGKTKTQWDDMLVEETEKPVSFLFMMGFFWTTYSNLLFSVTVNYYLSIILNVAFLASIIWLFFNLTNVLAHYLDELTANTKSKLDDQLVPLVRKTLKIFVVIIGIIFILQNNGINVTSLLAGLGLGGLAIALAARDSLANFFGSVTIFADQPFQVGELIKTSNVQGVVQEVGFRSTRLRTLYDSVISVPNSILANTEIDNLGLRAYRRLKMTINLSYDTSPHQMEAFVEGVKAIINTNKYIRQDNYEVHFNEMGAHSLDVLVYLFFDVPGWSEELQQRHNFLLQIMRLAEEVGVEFAFPTHTVHVDSFFGDEPRKVGKEQKDDDLAAVIYAFGPEGSLSKPEDITLQKDGQEINFNAKK